ncbi:MAG: serine/threonine-protein kinase [Pirellulales bacterium]
MSTTPADRLPADALLQLEEICDRFESAWRRGKPCDIGRLLDDFTGPLRSRLAFELAAVEIEYRRRAGEQPTADEYRGRLSLSDRELARLWPAAANEDDRFELRERLGAGAFGTVWRAWDRKLSRDVALKMAHRTLVDAPDKFLREARATARLQHPHIVRVLDVGETAEGLFIVREFVAGRTLSELLRCERVEAARAVEWCRRLADALDYIHAKGCIHRDLKPQNVLIDEQDRPFLCDFGLAKSNVTAAVTQTRTGDVLGTPAYMAPEQARGESHLVDPRSDIYSLGVILYQLLTGELPFRGSFERILIQVLRDEPPRPTQLNPKIPIDLATICLKCLEKEPESRYASARALADDLERYAEGRPVAARPLGTARRALRWSRRNPALAAAWAACAALGGALVVGGVVSYLNLADSWRAERILRQQAEVAREQAEQQAERARVESRISDQVTRFMETVFATSDPIGRRMAGGSLPAGEHVTARQLLDHAASRIDSELGGQPRVQARLFDTLGDVYRSLGLFEEAEKLFTRAALCFDESAAADAHSLSAVDRATHALRLGRLRQAQGRYAEAEELYRDAAREHALLFGADSLESAEVSFHRGLAELEQRRPFVAQPYFESTLRIRRKLLDDSDRQVLLAQLALWQCRTEPYGDWSALDLSSFKMSEFSSWGSERTAAAAQAGLRLLLARRAHDAPAARRAYQQLLDLARQELGGNHPLLGLLLGDYADFLYQEGDFRSAEPVIREAIEIGRRLAPRHPRVRDALAQFGYESMMAGRYEEAYRMLQDALACEFDDGERRNRAMYDAACAALALEKLDEAHAWSDRVMQAAVDSPAPERVWYGYLHARLLEKRGEREAAQRQDQANQELLNQIDWRDLPPYWQHRMSTIAAQAGRYAEAEEMARASLQGEIASRPADHPRVAEKLVAVARYCDRQQRPGEALPLLEQAYAIQTKQLPSDDRRTLDTRRLIEDLQRRVGE